MALYEVCKPSALPPNSMKSFTVSGKEILLVNLNGKIYAMDNRCPHKGGDLSKGTIKDGVVVCPLHGSRFEPSTGRAVSGPKIGPIRLKVSDLNSYPVVVDGDSVKVEIPGK